MGELVGHIAEMALVRSRVVPGDDYETVVASLRMTPSAGAIWYDSLDLGTPAVEDNVTPYASISGTYDATRFWRARAILVSLTVLSDWFPDVGTARWDQTWNNAAYWVQQLGPWATPNARFWLYLRMAGPSGPVYRIDVRGAGLPAAIGGGGVDRQVRGVSLSLISPSGLLRQVSEGLDLATTTKDGRVRTVIGYDGTEEDGRDYPRTFPVTYPGGYVGGATGIQYAGTVPTGCIVRVHAIGGAVHNPSVMMTDPDGNETTIGFQGLTIPDGHYLEVNSEAYPSARMDGVDQDNFLLGPLTWPVLQPGRNEVLFTQNANADATIPAAPGAGSYAEVLHYCAHFSG